MSASDAFTRDLRKKILELRRAQTSESRNKCSRQISDRFSNFILQNGFSFTGKKIASYYPFPEEVDVKSIEQSYLQGAEIACPKILSLEASQMEMVYQSKGVEHVLSPEDIDFVLVPGAVFDPHGNRIGLGKGFYDRYLVRCKKAIRIGLAFQFQIVEKTVPSKWDQRMNWILTEKETYGPF